VNQAQTPLRPAAKEPTKSSQQRRWFPQTLYEIEHEAREASTREYQRDELIKIHLDISETPEYKPPQIYSDAVLR
jgi:hypothetical protein